MGDFFTSQKTEPPVLTPLGLVLMLIALFIVIYSASRFYKQKSYQRIFQGLQIVQLVLLYSWYMATQAPLTESLPFYHCRIAMFAVLLLPRRTSYKQYFALLGVFGPICALLHPIFDPYPLPHITLFSYLVGHLALLGNSIVYLMNEYDYKILSNRRIIEITFGMNAVIFLVNQLTGGDYGFLKNPPLVGDFGMLGNFLLVSSVLVVALCGFSLLFKRLKEAQENRMLLLKDWRE